SCARPVSLRSSDYALACAWRSQALLGSVSTTAKKSKSRTPPSMTVMYWFTSRATKNDALPPAPSRRDRAAPTGGACRLRRPEKDGRSTAKPQLERIFGSPTGDGREPRVEGAVPGCALGPL